ncbi:zf-C2HC5-domain-containing protein [Sarocladium strictum]
MSLSQLSKLLPLPNEELQQVIDYAETLPKDEAASHFTNLLGDSPQAIEFISSFNARRQGPATSSKPQPAPTPAPQATASSSQPKKGGAKKKQKAPLHTPEARRLDTGYVPTGTAYNKKNADLEYIPQRGVSAPTSHQGSRSATPKPPQPSAAKQTTAAGYLISEAIHKPKPKSNPVSRSSTPKPNSSNTTKISITGGTPMIGASAAIADLDAAIRALEISTNPTLDDVATRKCDCVATRHPLQTAAPNCLSCGKVICVKEGLGPCTYCGNPLLSSEEVQGMVRELKEERGRERMAADAEAHRRPAVSKTPAPFSKPREAESSSTSNMTEAEAKARQHRDKLLNFQAQNAQRTTVRDEAADFDATRAGNMWATPEDRAKQLKHQQKLMREVEWNAKPEYEKRRQVVSIDLVGGKVVRRMAEIARPASPENDGADGEDHAADVLHEVTGNTAGSAKPRGGGAFSGNPLLGKLIKPTFEANGKGKDKELEGRPTKKGWRRVQDNLDDNEGVILDGGVHGHHTEDGA